MVPHTVRHALLIKRKKVWAIIVTPWYCWWGIKTSCSRGWPVSTNIPPQKNALHPLKPEAPKKCLSQKMH